MPRIRSIKPEFCTSEQVAECSTTARLLFVTMWCFCDDGGNHPASVRRLKMECFPGDPFTDADMNGFIDELKSQELLVEYEVENKRFWHVMGWKHQKIDKPSYKYPPFDEHRIRPPFDEHSASGSRTLDDCPPAERKGVEWKGEEGSGVESSVITKVITTGEQKCSPASTDSGFVFAKQSGVWHLPEKKLAEYVATYKFDVRQELLKAAQWLRDNKARRPRDGTGIQRFLTRWMNRHDGTIKPNQKLSGKIKNDDTLKLELERARKIREERKKQNGEVSNLPEQRALAVEAEAGDPQSQKRQEDSLQRVLELVSPQADQR
jgi:hypothetical protein